MGCPLSKGHSAWDGGRAMEESINKGVVLKWSVLIENVGKTHGSGATVIEKIVCHSRFPRGERGPHHCGSYKVKQQVSCGSEAEEGGRNCGQETVCWLLVQEVR